jgi:hypothetical protein
MLSGRRPRGRQYLNNPAADGVLGRENRRIANAVSFCATGSPPNIASG